MSSLNDNIGTPHSRYNKSHSMSSSRLSVPSGDYIPSQNLNYNATMTPSHYFARLVDYSQMDLQSALDQMRSLVSLSSTEMQKVYKMAYYRKQTKNHWARDDPAFVVLQVSFLALSSLAYCIAFHSENIFTSTINFSFHNIIINYFVSGVTFATATRALANKHLIVHSSTSHVRQSVEWLYAFDIHCNAFFPLFVVLYGVQFFMLPLVLGSSFIAFLVSNTLFAIAFTWYFYITHLGYRALPFISNSEWFLFPICVVLFLYMFNLIGWPFGFGWNASRIMAYIYFED